jgi:plastocyanin
MNSARITAAIFLGILALGSTGAAHVALDYPVGGETFTEGEIVNVQWHIVIPHDLLNWDLYFSDDRGTTWDPVELDLPPDVLNYEWTVPGIATTEGRIRIYMDNSGADYEDESENFTIILQPTFDVQVDIGDFFFDPVLVEIDAGQTVRWLNTVSTIHTTTAYGNVWDSGDMGLDDVFDFTLNDAGVYQYECGYHPLTMIGTVVVGDPADVVVEMGNYYFEPADIEINVGDKVRWVNTVTTTHTTTATGEEWDSGDMGLSDIFDFTFDSEGVFEYYCFYHSTLMQGTVTVVAPGGACEYYAGDCNHNGTALELGDVVAMIGIYRGSAEPAYACSCPPNGDTFAAEADPSGNCVAFELGDVVAEIGAYRGSADASGCADCPGL